MLTLLYKKTKLNLNKFKTLSKKIPCSLKSEHIQKCNCINDLENNTSLNVFNCADDTMLYKTFTKDTYLDDSKNFNIEQ